MRLKTVLLTLSLCTLFLVLCAVGAYLHYVPTLPPFHSIQDYQPKIGSRVFSADHQLMAEFARERRVLIAPEKMPALLPKAFIAAEDKRFYEHNGVDVIGMLQAVLDKFLHPGQKLRGASTITQQVAKNVFLSPERTLTRKVRELILTLEIERHLSKRQILATQLVDDLPTRVTNGELDLKDAQGKLTALMVDAVSDPNMRRQREEAVSKRLLAADAAYKATEKASKQ